MGTNVIINAQHTKITNATPIAFFILYLLDCSLSFADSEFRPNLVALCYRIPHFYPGIGLVSCLQTDYNPLSNCLLLVSQNLLRQVDMALNGKSVY